MEGKKIHTEAIKGNDVQSLQRALNKAAEAARLHSHGSDWGGSSTVHVESSDGLAPHSLETFVETLTDGSVVYNVRFLFAGDV